MNLDLSYRSPNFGSRGGKPIRMVVLHATVGSARSALAWLTNPAARVSAHYVVDKTGKVYQLVEDQYAAWHAGRAEWRGETAVNEISLGIELENANNGRDPYPDAQINALQQLIQTKVESFQIEPGMVTRHLDVALPRGRKSDPAGFPWIPFIDRIFPDTTTPDDLPPRPMPPALLQDALANQLLAEAFRQVGAPGQQYWSLARTALHQKLGMPLGPSFEIQAGKRRYAVQSFGRDTLFCPQGSWNAIQQLSQLRKPDQRELQQAVLTAIYAHVGETYHPDWATHQEALRAQIGPPIDRGDRLMVGGQEYVAACYALDVLYSPVGKWQTVGRLSQLADNGPQAALRAALYNRWCTRIGVPARKEWILHQEALRVGLGAPLGPSFRVNIGDRSYAAESFALDVLACEIGVWKPILRMSELMALPEGGALPTS
jgi:N-acetylmuramoyl-L-alanine amidase